MKITNLPLYIAASNSCHNPENVPDTYHFEYFFDKTNQIIKQKYNSSLAKILDDVYSRGLLIGTPLSDSNTGLPYANDFLNFINRAIPKQKKLRILEIGAGTGYLSHRLISMGHEVTPVEPGKGYFSYWKKYEVDVINDFFPSPKCTGPYDLVISYLVLEHIPDPKNFIQQIKDVLSIDGSIIFAVPNEHEEIIAGDPSMLVHEHFNYFDSAGLNSLLSNMGLSSIIEPSNYGRCLYSISKKDNNINKKVKSNHYASSYIYRSIDYIKNFRQKIKSLLEHGTVGVFCAGRALSLLEIEMEVRMFDDDPYLTNMYFPPFISKIENRSSLLKKPVDNLIIMSRTFGQEIRNSLIKEGFKKKNFACF